MKKLAALVSLLAVLCGQAFAVPVETNNLPNASPTNFLNNDKVVITRGGVTYNAWAKIPWPISWGGTGATTAADARTALGLGTMATQNANAVNISGGTISGVTFNGHASLDLAIANNLSELTATAGTARGNLGLGSMSTQSAAAVIITGGSVAATTLSQASHAITLGGALTTSGAYSLTATLTGNTNVTFPTSGTLATVGAAITLTTNHILVGVAGVATDVAMSGDGSIVSSGALTISSIGGKAVTLANSFTTVGNFALTLTQTGVTNVTLPTTGTLATLAGSETLTNKAISGGSNTLSAIANSSLTNSAVTIGSTAISLGATSTTLAGLTSVAATTFTGDLSGNATTATTASGVAVGGITGLGTGVGSALAVNVGSAGAPVLFNGAGGTPSSMTATNLSGTAASLNIGGTAPAGTLTGATLAAGVTASSLQSVGTLSNLTLGGTLAMGSNSITMTGSLAATGARVTKGWFTDVESTNCPTIGGTACSGSAGGLARTTSPAFTTPTIGAALATSINFGGATLSNYDTGLWTPVLDFGGGVTGITYSTQSGAYIRVGKLVYVNGVIVLTSKGSSTGNAHITGLHDAAAASQTLSFPYYASMATISGALSGLINNGSSTGVDLFIAGASGVAAATNANFTNTTTIIFTGSYSM